MTSVLLGIGKLLKLVTPSAACERESRLRANTIHETDRLATEEKTEGRIAALEADCLRLRLLERACTAEAELARVRSECDGARYLGDNHHNAAACPHCGDLLGEVQAELELAKQALSGQNEQVRVAELNLAEYEAITAFPDHDETTAAALLERALLELREALAVLA